MTRVITGTSGYAYKEWKGRFYPEKLPQNAMLGFYASQFPAVEINNTFYRMPKPDMLTKWCEQVPPEFLFILKASQRITHIKRLKDVGADVAYFFEVSKALGSRRGPSLFQLPPHSKRNDERLAAFLKLIPEGERVALEFRHDTWFDEGVYALLRQHNAALCLCDADDAPEGGEKQTPQVATADWVYARLRRSTYTKPHLQKLATWLSAQHFTDAFVFFKHEDGAKGATYARQFVELTGQTSK